MQYDPSQARPFGGANGGAQPGDAASAREAAQNIGQLVITTILVIVSFGAGWFGNSYANRAYTPTDPNEKLVIQAWNDIDQYYVVTGSIDHKKMAYAAINAMVQTLGDTGHTRFQTPEELQQETNQENNAPNVGIGIVLGGGGDQPITIQYTIPGAPAEKAGLRGGDIIAAVNGQSLKGMTLDQATPLIRGAEGTQVTLTIIRPSQDPNKTFDVTITRGKYVVPNVVTDIIPSLNLADIQIVQFSQDTDAHVKAAIKDAQNKGVTRYILDLRNNPGGLLDQAVAVTSEFVPSGSGKNVLIIKGRTSQETEPVQPGGLATSASLAILVNGDTASAAEITAGSIHVNRPDVPIIGQTTFGTGTVLQEIRLADGSAILMGTDEFFLPNGESFYHKGITPQQTVALPSGATPFTPIATGGETLTTDQALNAPDPQFEAAVKTLTGK